MAILKLLSFVVIFFAVSSVIEILYNYFYTKYLFRYSWLSPVLATLTVFVWMLSPSHWLVLIFFAITFGVEKSEKNKKPVKRKRVI